MNRFSTWVGLVALIVILTLFYFGHVAENFSGMVAGGDQNQTRTKLVLSVVAMLVGIIAGSFHRLWRTRKGPLTVAAVKAGFKSAELWRSLLASPLLFSGVYAAGNTHPDFVVACIFAFQTGFFTDTIIQGKAKETS